MLTTAQVRDQFAAYEDPTMRDTRTYEEEGELFDRWLAAVEADAFREGYDTARQDMVSGAFVGGPTFKALKNSPAGRRIAVEAIAINPN